MDLLGSCVKFMGCKLSRASTVIGISPQLAQGIFVYITFWNAKNAEHRGTCDSEPPCPHQRPGMLWSLPECANTGMPGDATMATSALLHIRRQNYGAPPAWFARSCATSSARVSAAGVQLVPSPTAKRSYVRQVWKSSARGTPRWVLWVSLGAKKKPAEDSQMMELLKMHELQQMQLALQILWPLVERGAERDGLECVASLPEPRLGWKRSIQPFWEWIFLALNLWTQNVR